MTAHRATRESDEARAGRPAPGLSAEEAQRYSRHLILPEIAGAGQERLKRSRVAIVGLGGLGSPAAIYLAAAGVGTLGLIDHDQVHPSNLHRQVLYSDADVGRSKCDVAAVRVAALNPFVAVERHPVALTSQNALDILGAYDLVLDGTDNFPTRYLVSDACVLLGIPSVYGSVLRFEGRVSVLCAPDGPCYRCLFPEPPPPDSVPDCATAGVLGVVPGQIGVLQATEAVKWLTRSGEALVGRLLLVDTLRSRYQTIVVRRNPECPACGTRTLRTLVDYEAFCRGERTPSQVGALSPLELHRRLAAGAVPQLLDVRELWEWDIARLPGAVHVPLARLPEALDTLDPTRETVVYCHHGSRSLAAATLLAAAGFVRVANLEGGIERWSVEVDAALARY